MSSKFGTRPRKSRPPSWCKPGMFTGIRPTENGRPVTLTAYVAWTADVYGNLFSIAEVVHLRRTPAGDGWYGESNQIAKYVTLNVDDTAIADRVDLRLTLFDGPTQQLNDLWFGVATSFRPPWGTDLLRKVEPPQKALIEMQIFA